MSAMDLKNVHTPCRRTPINYAAENSGAALGGMELNVCRTSEVGAFCFWSNMGRPKGGGRAHGRAEAKKNSKTQREVLDGVRKLMHCRKCKKVTPRYKNLGCVECRKAINKKTSNDLKAGGTGGVCIMCRSACGNGKQRCRLCNIVGGCLLNDAKLKLDGRFVSKAYGDQKPLKRELSLRMRNAEMCALTGEPFDEAIPMMSRSLDRVDSNRAHTLDNVQVVYQFVNHMKVAVSDELFRRMLKVMFDNGSAEWLLGKPQFNTTVRTAFDAMGKAAHRLPWIASKDGKNKPYARGRDAIKADRKAMRRLYKEASSAEIEALLEEAYGVSVTKHRQRLAYFSQVHIARTCARTNMPLIEDDDLYAPSIDAIDANDLHTLENTQIVCRAYNYGKNKYSAAAFDAVLARVIKRAGGESAP
jgi:ribosomal protein S26